METPLDSAYARRLHEFRKRLLENLASIELTQLKEGFHHEQILPKATYAPWRDDDVFMNLFQKIRNYTLVDIYRLYELYVLAGATNMADGDILEVGVWRGGSAAILGASSKYDPTAKLFLADTFTGVPKTSSNHNTLYRGGEHADASIRDVETILQECGIDNFEILQGIFPRETSVRVARNFFRLVHIDVDSYESASEVFNWVWPRVCVGGVVVFDDYGFWGCEGVAAFVNKLRKKNIFVIHNLNGHAIAVKVSRNDDSQILSIPKGGVNS
jgi:O-methyltransferase